ncbi:MAG: hypothetical protein IH943_10795 [Acidobacteria bacterium]|nr:hypothetical protein [Acidobacteriota bacterium]
MERGEAEELLRDCLARLVEENFDLFTSGAHERAVTSQLFRCLAGDPRIPNGVSVDHEYNRVGGHYVKNLRQFEKAVATDEYGDPIEAAAIPDILVHGRGDHESNLIAIEVKVNEDNDEGDRSKIWALLSEPYAYRYGVLLKILREDGQEGSQWTPYWAWNPPARQHVEYEEVFNEATIVELSARGRQGIAERLEDRIK